MRGIYVVIYATWHSATVCAYGFYSWYHIFQSNNNCTLLFDSTACKSSLRGVYAIIFQWCILQYCAIFYLVVYVMYGCKSTLTNFILITLSASFLSWVCIHSIVQISSLHYYAIFQFFFLINLLTFAPFYYNFHFQYIKW